MIGQLILDKVTAYTVHSADDERSSSNKGVYKDYNLASIKATGSGWYGSNGEVRYLEDVYLDSNSNNLYQVKPLGRYTDVEEAYKENLVKGIKSKLTAAELAILNL